MKGQNVKRLAQVLGFKKLSNFCILFTQARFAIKSKMKWYLIVLGGKFMSRLTFWFTNLTYIWTWCDIAVAYNFENLLKIQVQITCKSDNAKWVLKHYILIIWVSYSSHAQYFGLPAFAKSAISGPSLAYSWAKHKRQSGEENKNPNNLKVKVLKQVSKNLLPDKFSKNH